MGDIMSKIWGSIFITSIVISIFLGNANIVITSIMESGKNAITNVLELAGMMCFWSGIFNILENTSILKIFSKYLKKIIVKLFGKKNLSEKAIEYMSLNITSNIIGIGNASTLNGIKAIEELQLKNDKEDIPNDNMTTFVLLNTASIQIIPTSMIALRAMYGASNPSSIVVPVLIVTTISLIFGLTSIKILNKFI